MPTFIDTPQLLPMIPPLTPLCDVGFENENENARVTTTNDNGAVGDFDEYPLL
jgi:hypothetical protein